MVDTLGGITIDVDQDFSAGGYGYQVGAQQMNSKEALAYSKERHSFADVDNVRVKLFLMLLLLNMDFGC